VPQLGIRGQEEAFDPNVDVAVVRIDRERVFHLKGLGSVARQNLAVNILLIHLQLVSSDGPGYRQSLGQKEDQVLDGVSKENQVSRLGAIWTGKQQTGRRISGKSNVSSAQRDGPGLFFSHVFSLKVGLQVKIYTSYVLFI
jgi:hypothetical protein